ncbi:M20 metallopeptidase family protein [Bhargavaea ginsengi]|uniref:M20 metallopeptidase family protein n=1 Tax=Bhargavaea ginsengi TaxID=426757 RepID=UPI00203D53CC|nr:M20/M25/M40 family metallo-hydrolase [Bhargavaea ginsengi]
MIAAQALVTMQQIVSRQTDPLDSVVLSFGKIEGGTKNNIIPDSVRVEGTVRTMLPETRARMEERMRAIAEGVAEGLGGSCKLTYHYGVPSVKNADVPAQVFEETVDSLFGPEALKKVIPAMGGEDFSFSEQVPSVFFRLGTHGIDDRTAYANHNNRFDVDEDAFLYGIATFIELTNRLTAMEPGEFE